MQPDKNLAHRAREILVHREILAIPIYRGPEPFHLIENRAAIVPFPFPHALNKSLAPHVTSLLAFAGQLAFDHHLRGDSSVVSPREPQRQEPPHAMPAHHDVHLCLAEHVTHMQPSGNVRRRKQQRENRARLACRRCWRGKEFLLDPVLGPARFNRARFVGFRQVVGHEWTAPSLSQFVLSLSHDAASAGGIALSLMRGCPG